MRALVCCQPENATTQPGTSSESTSDLSITSFLGCILATMCLVGAVGNIYTLVVTPGSLYMYTVSLALSGVLYLPTVPFVVHTYFVRDWYFRGLGWRMLFSLHLLTMHASIFILTSMSPKHYLAVVSPLDTLHRSRDHWRVVTCLGWLVAFLLTMILINLHVPPLADGAYKVYLTVLFSTCLLALSLIICCLYLYRRSQWALVPRKPADVPPKRSCV